MEYCCRFQLPFNCSFIHIANHSFASKEDTDNISMKMRNGMQCTVNSTPEYNRILFHNFSFLLCFVRCAHERRIVAIGLQNKTYLRMMWSRSDSIVSTFRRTRTQVGTKEHHSSSPCRCFIVCVCVCVYA